MSDTSLHFLKKLLETPAPSGFESRGQRVWSNFTSDFSDKIESDSYGNVFATLNPEASPKIVLAGHGDELGLMISHIHDEGFLFFKGIGGVDRGLLRGQRVVISGKNGPVQGVIGHLAIHLQEPDDRKKTPEFHDLFIDIGVSNRDAAAQLVRVGNSVTIAGGVWELESGRLAARSCDNRIGTWAAAEALRLLKASGCAAQVVAVSTVQEENGLYGATMVGYRLRPSVALVVDVTHATDIPPCSKSKHGDVKMGAGPVISLGSSNHPVVCEHLMAIAEKKQIPYQLEANPRFTGTDADAIFLQRGGIPTVSLGLPNRYMHSPVEVIDLGDLSALAALLAAFCESVNSEDSFRVSI